MDMAIYITFNILSIIITTTTKPINRSIKVTLLIIWIIMLYCVHYDQSIHIGDIKIISCISTRFYKFVIIIISISSNISSALIFQIL